MKNYALLFLIVICSIILFACKHKSSNAPVVADTGMVNKTEAVIPDSPDATTATSARLLQGKWQNIEDTSNYLVFEQNRRKEIAKPMVEWDNEPYVLNDRCANPSDKNMQEKPEADRYISCPESDLCWYILSLDSVNLSLSYMARGNRLQYKRVR